MSKRQAGSRKINRRYRRAAERIWENSTLRDELNDDQASRLLNWGSGYLKQAVNETAGLGDEDADPILEAQTGQVSVVIRQINELAGAMASGNQQLVSERLKELKESVGELTGTTNRLTDFIQSGDLPEGDSAQMFEELMSLLDGEEE